MRGFQILAFSLFAPLLASNQCLAQDNRYDVFVPIAKYMRTGDVEKLSSWFADNLEIAVVSKPHNSSKDQARQIMKTFFSAHTPHSFDITHNTGRSNVKYALGILNAGGERFRVTIFVSYEQDYFKIQQLKIERIE